MELITIAVLIVTVLLTLYLYLKIVYLDYWKRKGLPYIEPEFYYGNVRKVILGEICFGEVFRDIYRELKSRGLRHGGAFMSFSPFYVPTDPEIIKCILQKDFDHFINRGMYYNEEDDPLSGHLFNLEDAKWRDLRAKLTPTFTSGKMKMMFPTLVQCSDGLEEVIRDHSIIQDAVDIKEVAARFTTDVIGSCAFGIDCNTLKNPDSDFRKYGKMAFPSVLVDKIKLFISLILPSYILRMVHFRTIRKDVESFFMTVVEDTVDYREKNNVLRKDFIHLMLQIKNKGKVADSENVTDEPENTKKREPFLTMNEIAAQCFVFFLAGFETSSTTMTFALYELAINQDIQDKLREDIRTTLQRHNGELTYESIMEMSYLDKVVNETLRLHPPLGGTPRLCNKAYPVPGTDFVLEPGVLLNIPIYGLHMDPEYYPNPEMFDPERFSEENKTKRPAATFLPFGDGPRICIDLRFGMMQTKVGLVTIIKEYKVTLNEKTKTPMKLDPGSPILAVDGGVWLNISKV